MLLEFGLGRYLVKPIFSIFLTIGAALGVAALFLVLSMFQNYYLSTEKVFMGIHPHIEIQFDYTPEEKVSELILKLKKQYSEMSMAMPALYVNETIEFSKAKARQFFCLTPSNTAECIKTQFKLNFDEAGDFCIKPNHSYECQELDKVSLDKNIRVPSEIGYGFHIKERKTKEVLIKGITVKENTTVMDIARLIQGDRDLDYFTQTTSPSGSPLPLSFFMEGSIVDLGLELGEDFLLQANNINTNIQHHYRLKGLLEMGGKKGIVPLMVVSLKNAQTLLDKHGMVNTIEIKLTNPHLSTDLARRIQLELGESYQVSDWASKEQASFQFLRVSKQIAFVLIFSISLVAALGVYSTLLLAVIQNRKKIAILKALGIKNYSIYLIFISKALSIAIIGFVIGAVLGYLGSEAMLWYFGENLKNLGITHPKTEITLLDVFVSAVIILILFLLTAIAPARHAVKIDPAENLQH